MTLTYSSNKFPFEIDDTQGGGLMSGSSPFPFVNKLFKKFAELPENFSEKAKIINSLL